MCAKAVGPCLGHLCRHMDMTQSNDTCHVSDIALKHSSPGLQNALKVFSNFPPELMDIVNSTDPSTVTQHGLYIRDLGPDSLSKPLQRLSEAAREELEGQKQRAAALHESGQQGQGHQAPAEGSNGQLLNGQKADKKGSNGQESGGKGTNGQDPAGIWGRGRVTLLGDAAHANVPNGKMRIGLPAIHSVRSSTTL